VENKSFEIKKNEWKDETEERQDGLIEFLKNNTGKKEYNSFSDLHFSGTNRTVFDKIVSGTANILKVDVFYVDNKIEQIHLVFDSEHQGHNIDVYLYRKALKDYLEKMDK